MKTPKPTLVTLAQATGLSLATVSRALAGSPSVLPATRDLVINVACKMGYVRDRTAVRLKTGRTQVLAFVMDRPDANQPGFQDLMLGLSEAVQGTDYQLIVLPEGGVASVGGDDPLMTVRYIVERGMADGLVLSHTTPQDKRVAYLLQRGFPFITHGRTRLGRAHSFVDFANEQFSVQAVEALCQRGRKRLGLLLPMPGSAFRGHLQEGFQRACDGVAPQSAVSGTVLDGVSLDDEPEALYQWARVHAAQFDGLVVSREAPVLPLLSALADAGLRPGQDIDVVLKASSALPHYLRQPLLVCQEDLRQAGRTLGHSLIDQLTYPDQATAQHLFAPPPLQIFPVSAPVFPLNPVSCVKP